MAAERFVLDQRLEGDSIKLTRLGLCTLRLMNDSRWPWLLLVPQRVGIEEIHQLTPLDQTMLTFETALVSAALKEATGCEKINIGALGNRVRQLHIHVIARNEADTNWPDPVWGFGKRKAYQDDECKELRKRILGKLEAQNI
ncbi:HIT domain-containing protein [Limoniibacter endophyticus]|uniref:HIT domain-containing protein n=1 Tax=Limoniibacter endophyticus TaxID=1565040 RepID=A0A8J3DNU4_9HYPH|nr:HIT family protein [Limoniibacter endophyticus]GHC67266.1 hypothetical protein GCM10010136_11170 [Limoniibacter endophyticus]